MPSWRSFPHHGGHHAANERFELSLKELAEALGGAVWWSWILTFQFRFFSGLVSGIQMNPVESWSLQERLYWKPSKESITRLQLAATTNTYEENQQPVTSEIRQRWARIVHGFDSLEGIFWCAMLTFWPSLQKTLSAKNSRKVLISCDEGDGS